MKTKTVFGEDLVVGMRIIPWHDRSATIVGLEPYNGDHSDIIDFVVTTECIHEDDSWHGGQVSITSGDTYTILEKEKSSFNMTNYLKNEFLGKTLLGSEFMGKKEDDPEYWERIHGDSEFGGVVEKVGFTTDEDGDPMFYLDTTKGFFKFYDNDTISYE